MSSRSPFDADPASGTPVERTKRNPSRKRLEGFLKWENETPRRESEQDLGSTLARLVDYLGMGGRLHEQRAVEIWPEVVGDAIAAVTKAISIKNGILTIEVVNPSWRQELSYLAPDILSKVNRTLGNSLVKKLRFC